MGAGENSPTNGIGVSDYPQGKNIEPLTSHHLQKPKWVKDLNITELRQVEEMYMTLD